MVAEPHPFWEVKLYVFPETVFYYSTTLEIMWCNVAQPLGSREQLWESAASLPHTECNMRNGALKRIKQALKIPLAAQQQGRQRCFSVNNSCVMPVKYLFKNRENLWMFVCRSVVVVSEVSLPLPRLPPLSPSHPRRSHFWSCVVDELRHGLTCLRGLLPPPLQ